MAVLGALVLIVALWLFSTMVLCAACGWGRLTDRYRDTGDVPLRRIRFVSGELNKANFRGVLRLETTPGGLRVRISRLFAPFTDGFLVPWPDIRVVRLDSFFLGRQAELTFGGNSRLRIQAYVADQLARSVPDRWPEAAPPARETVAQSVQAAVKGGALRMLPFAAFVIGLFAIVAGWRGLSMAWLLLAMLGVITGIGALWNFAARRRA